MPDIGKTIKYIRESKGIKQYDLASMCSISKGTMNRIENTNFIPSYNKIESICESLGINSTELIVLSLDIGELPTNCRNTYKLLRKRLKRKIDEYLTLNKAEQEEANRRKITRCFQCEYFLGEITDGNRCRCSKRKFKVGEKEHLLYTKPFNKSCELFELKNE